MDSNAKLSNLIDPHQIEEFEDKADVTTKISVSSFVGSEGKQIKKQLYLLAESANNLRMSIRIRNIEKIIQNNNSCKHFMKSCNRTLSYVNDLCMILKSLESSTRGTTIHYIELLD